MFGKPHLRAISKMSTSSIGRKIIRSYAIPLTTKPLLVDGNGNFKEKDTGRIFHMHGINFASNTKMPDMPMQTTHLNAEHCGLYEDGDTVSFVGKPFPLSECYQHISRIKQCGFNTIRFVTTWEAIEHEGPGIYDLEYANYITKMIQMIDEVGGLYVFIDPHQDVWSRFSGGSGAPMWTLYAAGLEPRNFEKTNAAKIHNHASDPQNFTKMVWATNYNKLASETMFTMFFNGTIFTPKANINDVNIETFLQSHFIEAFAFLMQHIKNEIPDVFNSCLLGIESINEPNNGFYGLGDLNEFPHDQQLRLDETPTPIQSMRLGMGIPEEVDIYSLSMTGPTKIDKKWCDPDGIKAWATDEDNHDKHYGFRRSKNWKLGECIFAQHGVWDSSTGQLILPDYFKVHPETGEYLDETKFINGPFLEFWSKFKTRMREIDNNMFLIMQAPVLQIPPNIHNKTKYLDERMMVSIHYYDGMSLMFQKWNKMMNVDTLGIMRGKYFNPIFAIVLGESNIRKSIQKQLKNMAIECYENVGYSIPVVITETGMPFNMDNKKSYDDGNYESQEGANDAIMSALEREQLNFTYWCYNPDNCHQWGDLWNLEDFSIWSKDDLTGFRLNGGNSYDEWLFNNATLRGSSRSDGDIESTNSHSDISINKELIKETTRHLNTPLPGTSSGYELNSFNDLKLDLTDGIRAINAIVRPVPILINGDIKECQFDTKKKTFHLEIIKDRFHESVDSLPDIITIPEYHYNNQNFRIKVSSGVFEIRHNVVSQWIEWDHSMTNDRIVELDIELIENYTNTTSSGCIDSLKAFACGYL